MTASPYGIPSPQLLEQLERHEAFRALPYLCPANRVTIGYGTNLEAHPEYIDDDNIRQRVETGRLRSGALLRLLQDSGLKWTRERARAAMLDEVVSCREQLFLRCRQFRRLAELGDTVRAEVLLNMAFNMGVAGLLKFVRTLALVDGAIDGQNTWEQVEAGLRNSLWWKQVGVRSRELGRQIVTGHYMVV